LPHHHGQKYETDSSSDKGQSDHDIVIHRSLQLTWAVPR
jgi:hypothetical protein